MQNNSIERRLRTELVLIVLLGILAILVCLLAAFGVWKPVTESRAVWFQRSGAIASVFCVVAQLRINGFIEKIRGGSYAESWNLFNLFEKHQSGVSLLITMIAVLGAVVWGYGDLLFTSITR